MGLCIIVLSEFLYCFILCLIQKIPDAMANLIFLSPSFGGFNTMTETDKWQTRMVIFFCFYRIFSFYFYMSLVSVFCFVPFEVDKVEAFDTRNSLTMNISFGFFMFIYGWISGPIWHCIGWYLYKNGIDKYSAISRDVETMYKSRNYSEIIELAEFGVPMTSNNQYYIFKACVREFNEYSRDLMEKIIKESGNNAAKVIDDNELLYLAVLKDQIKAIKYLIDNGCDVNKKNTEYYDRTPLMCINSKNAFDILIKKDDINKFALDESVGGYSYYDWIIDKKELREYIDEYFNDRGIGDCSKEHGLKKIVIAKNEKENNRCNICAKQMNDYQEVEVNGCESCNYYECNNCNPHSSIIN